MRWHAVGTIKGRWHNPLWKPGDVLTPYSLLLQSVEFSLDYAKMRRILRGHFFENTTLRAIVNRSEGKGRDARFRFSDYRYTFLALSVVFLFLVMPLLEREEQPFVPFLFLSVMAVVLWTLGLSKVLFGLCVVLGLSGFVFSLCMEMGAVSEPLSQVVELALLVVYTSFYGICLSVFLHRIFSEKMITADTIQGGIAIYFLSGLLWAFLYQILLAFDSSAISLPVHTSGEFSELIYFSFITLTTLGYGEITPVSWMAQNLTVLEAVWGQTYLVVLVARLVGLHLSGGGKSDRE